MPRTSLAENWKGQLVAPLSGLVFSQAVKNHATNEPCTSFSQKTEQVFAQATLPSQLRWRLILKAEQVLRVSCASNPCVDGSPWPRACGPIWRATLSPLVPVSSHQTSDVSVEVAPMML